MSVTITQRPQKTINASIPQISRWNSAWLPNIFKFQRADYDIDEVEEYTSSPNGILLSVGSTDFSDELEVGDTIYVYVDGYYDGAYEILDFFFTTPTMYIVIDAPVVSGLPVIPTDSFINILNRTAYFLEVRVLEYTTGAPVEVSSDYAQFRPNSTGLIKADLQAWLQPLLSAQDEFTYDVDVARDPNLGQPYNIQYREYWRDNGYTDWSDLIDDNLHYTANAVKQTLDRWGQNLGELVMFPADTSTPIVTGSIGKFLTMFDVPVYWSSYPFDLSFIYSQEIEDNGLPVNRYEDWIGINGNSVGGNAATLTGYPGYINRMMLGGGYSSNTYFIDLMLRAITDDAYVDAGYVDPDYVDEGNQDAYSEVITIEVGQTCENNPIYLRWLNPKGGFDSWLFSNAQDIKDKVDGEKKFEPYAEDIGEVGYRNLTQSKDSQEEITLGFEGLTTSQAHGLRHLLASPQVNRYMGLDEDTGYPKWQTVQIKTGTFLIERTDQNKHDIELTILPPEKFLQRQ